MALAAAADPALAKHGKVGLWNVTSTTDIALPAAAAAAMKKYGEKMPAAQPITIQMCMSKEEVDADAPPHLDRAATGCDMHIVTQSAALLDARMIFGKGNMKGNGSIRVTYTGAEHYSGIYSFTGTTYGAQTNISTHFKGDWVKADCGKVAPYKLRTQ